MIGGKGLGIGDVERCAKSSRREVGQQRVLIDQSASTDIDQQRAVLHARQSFPVHERPAVCQRESEDDDVETGEQSVELLDGPGVDPAAGEGGHGRLEGLQSRPDGPAHTTPADDRDVGIGECAASLVAPRPRNRVAGGHVDTPLGGDRQAHREFGRARVVYTHRRQYRDVGRHVRADAVDAGHQGLYKSQAGHVAHESQIIGHRHVRRHEEGHGGEYVSRWVGLSVIPPVILDTSDARRLQPLRQQHDLGHPPVVPRVTRS